MLRTTIGFTFFVFVLRMMMAWAPLGALVAFSAVAVAGAVANDAKRNITENDLFNFQWIGDPQVSTSGNDVVYVAVTVDEKRGDYESALFRVSTAGGDTRRLTSGKRDSSPRWSPDGKNLAFLRSVEKDGKPQPPQLWILPMAGGEPWQLTQLPLGVQQPAWSPDGRTIAFLATANEQDLARANCEQRKDAPDERATVEKCRPVRDSDVKVITRVEYRSNGEGYRNFSRPSHLWVVAFTPEHAERVVPTQLTRGDFDEGEFVWAPDGGRIYFASDRDHEPYYLSGKQRIYSVPSAGGDAVEVSRFAGRLSALSINPQGTRLAFIGTLSEPVQSHTQSNLWVLELGKLSPAKNLTEKYDGEIGDGIIGDQGTPRAGGGSRPVWSADGNAITVVVAKEGRANLERFDLSSGVMTPVTRGDQAVTNYAANGSQLVVRISNAMELNELYVIGAGAPRRITAVNEKLFSALKLTPPEAFWYKSFDGRRIHALVQTPPDFDPRKKYPLILNIHGGPHAAYGFTFFHEMQWMAARGYVVLYPNPRGSTTYGEAFANIIQYRYPGDDYRDLMAGVDELVRRGSIDEKRLGVTGGSGGGLLTNWAIGQTDRFAAAVSQRDIADWSAWWYSADFSLFQPAWFRKPPFEDPAEYRNRSPMTFINKVKTPTMFILGDVDSRTPAEAGGDQMFRALKYRKIPSVMVRFPGESHDLSRSGKPWHRVERLQHIVNWFDVYLQDKKVNDYAIMPPATPDLRATPPQ